MSVRARFFMLVIASLFAGGAQEAFADPHCASRLVITDATHASSTVRSFTGTTVTIMGQFIVDDDVLFQSCQVFMEAGAEIVVLPGFTLDVMSSSVVSCRQIMWKGITAQGGSTVRMRGSFVDDAENAITALDGSTLWLRDNQFHNNRVTLHVPEMEGVPWNNVAAYIRSNTFYSQGPMPQPYPGQATAVGSVGYAAFDVHNMYLDLTGYSNKIHHKSNGVVAGNSDVRVENCSMRDIQPDAAYNALVGNGAGINCNGEQGWHTLKQFGSGAGATDPYSFKDCHWGIYTQYMSVYSSENFMDNVGTAYRVEKSGMLDVDILGNRLDTRRDGIVLVLNDGASHVLVEGNDITFGNDASCTACKGYTAIHLSEGNIANSDSRILGNTIRFLPQNASRFGIFMNAANDWLVAGNTLQMAHNGHNRTGIQLYGCNRPEVSCNTVKGGSNGYPQDAQAAIRNMLGSDVLIGCNVVDLTTNGILFNGVAPNTDLRGNKLNRHRWGLHLDGTAIIDVQDRKGNLWYQPAPLNGLGAWYEVSNFQAQQYQFLYNPATINGGSTQPPSWSPPNWFLNFPGLNYDCSDDGGVDYCSQFKQRGKEQLTELDVKVASDSLENNPYTDESKWMLKSRLYKKLDENTDILDSLQLIADLYDELQGSVVVDLKEVGDEQLHLYDHDSVAVAELQANRFQMDSIQALVKAHLQQLLDSTLSAAQQEAILASINSHRVSLSNLSELNTNALGAVSALKSSVADDAQAFNASILANALIEANEKSVNDIYLAVIGKDAVAFTADQASALHTIASQCPMLGGNAVFRARALYWLIDDAYEFEDAAVCLPHGIVVKSMHARDANVVSVVPNPAIDEAALVLVRPLERIGSLTVCSAIGEAVLRIAVPPDMQRMSFNTAGLSPGNYQYTLSSGAEAVGSGKLTIIR